MVGIGVLSVVVNSRYRMGMSCKVVMCGSSTERRGGLMVFIRCLRPVTTIVDT